MSHKYDTLKFVSIGISHWETPLDLRGQFSFTEAQMQLIIEEAKENGCTGIFIVSTCNRSQLFAHTSNTFMLKEIFYKHVNVNRDVIDKHIFLLSGDEAVHHLFELCSGLDSLMLGDLQIISQVKDAVHFSEKLNGIDGYIHRLMQYVLQSYKTVSTDTDINKGPASVAHAAVLFIKERFPQIHDKKMLLFGLGEIGETTLKNLYENYKTGRITIINRTKSKAEALAKGMNIRVADMSELNEEVELADIVIVATGAQTPTLQLDDLSNAITAEKKLLLDLSVPRNIDPKIDELCNIDLIDMDKEEKKEVIPEPAQGSAYTESVAFESSKIEGVTFDTELKLYTMDAKALERYARIVAYKTANNIRNGFKMDQSANPLKCGGKPVRKMTDRERVDRKMDS